MMTSAMRPTMTMTSLAFAGVLVGCTHPADWGIDRARTDAFSVTHEVGLRNGQPERVEREQLEFRLNGQGSVEIVRDGESFGSFPISRGGHLTVSAKPPPYEAIVLAHLLPRDGAEVRVGDTWQTFFPDAVPTAGQEDKIVLQDRYSLRVTGIREDGGSKLIDLAIEGDVRVVENDLLRTIRSGADAATAAQVDRLTQFLPSVDGVAVFDATRNRVHAADLQVLLFPRTDVQRGQIENSEHRRHVTVAAR